MSVFSIGHSSFEHLVGNIAIGETLIDLKVYPFGEILYNLWLIIVLLI